MAEPHECQIFGTKFYDDGVFQVTLFQGAGGRYILYKGKYKLAELISGKNGLDKYYKSDILYWIDEIKKKDLKKVEKIRE